MQPLKDILTEVERSLGYQFGTPGCFSISDLIQIIKELSYITKNNNLSSNEFSALANHPATTKILLVLLTRDYDINLNDVEDN